MRDLKKTHKITRRALANAKESARVQCIQDAPGFKPARRDVKGLARIDSIRR